MNRVYVQSKIIDSRSEAQQNGLISLDQLAEMFSITRSAVELRFKKLKLSKIKKGKFAFVDPKEYNRKVKEYATAEGNRVKNEMLEQYQIKKIMM